MDVARLEKSLGAPLSLNKPACTGKIAAELLLALAFAQLLHIMEKVLNARFLN